MKTINGKFVILLWAMVVLMSLAIKFYFIPKTDGFLEKSVEHEMTRNMEAFSKIIETVVVAANGNHEVVRRALLNINDDPEIPVTLKRSQSISNQFGDVPEKNPSNSAELQVFRNGIPIFKKRDSGFEYIYPLKSTESCQTCHLSEDKSETVQLGYVLGVAIAQVPHKILRESKLFFFVKDLFVINMILFAMVLVSIYFSFRYWVSRPLAHLESSVSEMTSEDDEYHEFEMDGSFHDEIEMIELYVQELAKRSKIVQDS